MNLLAEIRSRFDSALADSVLADSANTAPQRAEYVDMVRRSQDPKFGDYQANFAMALGKRLGRPPRDVANDVVARLRIDDLCEPPEVAGPGFINLRIKDSWLAGQLAQAVSDPRLGIAPAAKPQTFVIDYSAPNVAKPMHVGHIRSTVIGDALYRTLKFLGHRVIGDNHIGDWGTQFGMIIYGYKHFRDAAAYQQCPVDELARLYRTVNQLVEYHTGQPKLPAIEQSIAEQEAALAAKKQHVAALPKGEQKAAQKEVRQLEARLAESRETLAELQAKLARVETSPQLQSLAAEHRQIAEAVLAETAKLHAGDAENVRLWHEFLPPCLEALEQIYRRLHVKFDHALGESFYHDRLAAVVADLKQRGLARESEGAVCVFLEGYDTPMIVQKQDGAFLYATSDLATIQYRMQTWSPDAMLYVVDHRQSLHFAHLFAAARAWGYREAKLEHVGFGTVMGDDGKPFKTRSGDTVGLSGLLDEAVRRAHLVVSENDDGKPDGPELSAEERLRIAEIVGIAALKYADLSQNRTSDYVFSYDKMLAMNGNTATYLQYAYARVRSIFRKGNVEVESLRRSGTALDLSTPAERALGIEVLRCEEAIEQMLLDYQPNLLTGYLYELAERYSTFYQQSPVLKAEPEALRHSRLLLCDLTARTIQKGLELLGIDVVEKMQSIAGLRMLYNRIGDNSGTEIGRRTTTMAARKDNAFRILRIKQGDDLKTIYAKIKRSFTAADLQRFTDINESDLVPAEQVVAELQAIDRSITRKRKAKELKKSKPSKKARDERKRT